MNVLGLDIGGANIKCADVDGRTAGTAFPMWQKKDDLVVALRSLASEFLQPDLIGLTTTAELADCFDSKHEGVSFVVNSVQTAFPGIPVRCWLTSGEFAEPNDALDLTELVAAANWHALATWAARAVPDGPAVIVDMGSTTTDIIPLLDGIPVPKGRTDLSRLHSGELLYSGAWRTPICSVVSHIELRGSSCRPAAEFFGTMADAFVVTNLVSEQADRCDTADGRPLTKKCCQNRLAHVVCCDSTELTDAEIVSIAEAAIDAQCSQLHSCLSQVTGRLEKLLTAESRSLEIESPALLISGSGTLVLQRYLEQLDKRLFGETLIMSEVAGPELAASASAFAVACLAHDLCRDDLLATTEWTDS